VPCRVRTANETKGARRSHVVPWRELTAEDAEVAEARTEDTQEFVYDVSEW